MTDTFRGLPEQVACCAGKTAYPSHGAALRPARRMRNVRIYRCPYCHHWHVGHPSFRHQPGGRNG